MARQLYSVDPFTQTRSYIEWTEDDVLHFTTEQDFDALKDHNRHKAAEQGRSTIGKDMILAGSLPPVIYMKLLQEGIIHDSKRLLRWLEENPAFKAHDGRLI